MVGGEGGGVGGIGTDAVRGGSPAPADRIWWYSEVTPSGVVICAAIHHRH